MGLAIHLVGGLLVLVGGFVLGSCGGAMWMRDQLAPEISGAEAGAARARSILAQLLGAVVACKVVVESARSSAADRERAGKMLEDAVRFGVRELGGWH